jgi:hypothetical protein
MMDSNRWIGKAIRTLFALVITLGLCMTPGPAFKDAQALPPGPPVITFIVTGPTPFSDQPVGTFLINGVCPDAVPLFPVCTLREAVAEANAAGAALVPPAYAMVNFAAPFPIDVYYGPIIVQSNVVIMGMPGAGPMVNVSMAPPPPPLPPPLPIPYALFMMTGTNSEVFGLFINSIGTITDGIAITGNGNTVDMNIILGCKSAAVHISGPGPAGGVNNSVVQNWLGMNQADNCFPNVYGIHLDGNASSTGIYQNYISCNLQHGVYIDSTVISPVVNTTIGNNWIGTNSAGTAARPNQLSGIFDDSGSATVVTNNLISGNLADGVTLDQSTSTKINTNNLIGTDISGTSAVPNAGDGVHLGNGTNSVIIGPTNVISGNSGDGIYLTGTGTTGNKIIRNFIGLDITGTADVGNGGDGVDLDTVDANTIGSLIASEGRNVISGNTGDGIYLHDGDDNLIYSNFIGMDVSGLYVLRNNGNGIRITGSDSEDNIISPLSPVEPMPVQVIACNAGSGIVIHQALRTIVGPTTYIGVLADRTTTCGNLEYGVEITNAVDSRIHAQVIANNGALNANPGISVFGGSALGNRIGPDDVAGSSQMDIYNNGGLSIDLGDNGHTPNDPADADSGPNTLLNYPEVTSLVGTTITGTVCNNCEVLVFEAVGNPAGAGGGGLYRYTVTASGTTWYGGVIPGSSLAKMTFVAYDPTTGNTSEMSPRFLLYLPVVIRP